MAQRDITITIPALRDVPFPLNGETYVYVKSAPKNFKLIVDQSSTEVQTGDLSRFDKTPDSIELSNPNLLPMTVVLTVGDGDFRRYVVDGKIRVATGVMRSDGTYVNVLPEVSEFYMGVSIAEEITQTAGDQDYFASSDVRGGGIGRWDGKWLYCYNVTTGGNLFELWDDEGNLLSKVNAVLGFTSSNRIESICVNPDNLDVYVYTYKGLVIRMAGGPTGPSSNLSSDWQTYIDLGLTWATTGNEIMFIKGKLYVGVMSGAAMGLAELDPETGDLVRVIHMDANAEMTAMGSSGWAGLAYDVATDLFYTKTPSYNRWQWFSGSTFEGVGDDFANEMGTLVGTDFAVDSGINQFGETGYGLYGFKVRYLQGKTYQGRMYSTAAGIQLFKQEAGNLIDADIAFVGGIGTRTVKGEIIKAVLQAQLGASGVPLGYMDYISMIQYESPSRTVLIDANTQTLAAAELDDNFEIRSPSTIKIGVLPGLL